LCASQLNCATSLPGTVCSASGQPQCTCQLCPATGTQKCLPGEDG
jgi:hypothetical protein